MIVYMHIEYKHRDGMHVDVLIVNNKKDGANQKHKLPPFIFLRLLTMMGFATKAFLNTFIKIFNINDGN